MVDWNILLGEVDKLILCKRFVSSQYDFYVWSDDFSKGGEEQYIVGVYIWYLEINKFRVYVFVNSLIVSGLGKYQYDVECYVVCDEYGIINVLGLVGDNVLNQKGKVNGLIVNNLRVFGKDMFFVGFYFYVLNIMLRRMC